MDEAIRSQQTDKNNQWPKKKFKRENVEQRRHILFLLFWNEGCLKVIIINKNNNRSAAPRNKHLAGGKSKLE